MLWACGIVKEDLKIRKTFSVEKSFSGSQAHVFCWMVVFDLAVKSSTKKRLMELGVSEEHAHRLADDANMDAIKRMTVDQVA